jgi:hypothetical protein
VGSKYDMILLIIPNIGYSGADSGSSDTRYLEREMLLWMRVEFEVSADV